MDSPVSIRELRKDRISWGLNYRMVFAKETELLGALKLAQV